MAGLVLDAQHRYWLDGQRLPGVTSILKDSGLVDAHMWATQWHLDKGKAIHLAAEFVVKGTLDWSTVDERILPYLKGLVAFLEAANCCRPAALPELVVCSERYGYAGKLDLVAPLFGQLMLADWKSGALGPVGPQTAGYEIAYRETFRIKKPLPRIAVQLRPDGTYKMRALNDPQDYLVWLKCVTNYHAKERTPNHGNADSPETW